MELLLRLLNPVVGERIVVVLLHSLWQGSMIVVMVWAFLRALPARQPRLRYGAALFGLLAVLLAAMATYHLLSEKPPEANRNRVAVSGASHSVQQSSDVSTSAAGRGDRAKVSADAHSVASKSTSTLRPAPGPWEWVASLWFFGTFVMLARAGWLLLGAGRLLRNCQRIDDIALLQLVAQLKRSMRIARPVRLATGPKINVPAVLGVFAPVVLLPLAVLNDMPIEHVQMILAHELAHVRRHDYVVNLFQLLIEAFLFFNPAVWWLSRQVRVEREACCDAMAIAATGSGPAYVRSLAAVMAGLVGSEGSLRIAPALNGEGTLLDRVKRLMLPGYQPQARVPWYSFFGMSAIAIALLIGMWRGTQAAVEAAEHLMTPAERVVKMAQLQDELGTKSLTSEMAPETSVLTGAVRTEDGSPLDNAVDVLATLHSKHETASYALRLDRAGHFSEKVIAGRVQISVAAPGYAPTIVEPFAAQAGATSAPIELVLKRGFDATLHVTDREGKAVPKAQVSVGYLRPPDTVNPIGQNKYTTDAEGTIIVHHAGLGPAAVIADLRGYEYEVITTRFQPGVETTVKLTPAKLVSGVVIDATTRKPIDGATIALVSREDPSIMVWNPGDSRNRPPVLAKTDDEGRFVVDSLRHDWTYGFWVTAPDHGAQLLRGVQAGQTGLEFALGAPQVVTVQIFADAAHMPKEINANSLLSFVNTSWGSTISIPVEVKDGMGIASISNPLPGDLRFSTRGVSARVDTSNVDGPVVLDLRSVGKPQAKRELVLKLHWPKDGAEPRGKIRVNYLAPEHASSYTSEEVDIKSGEARLSLPAPCAVNYSQGTVAGYWVVAGNDTKVPEGNQPFVIDVPAEPAGAIQGSIVDQNNKPFTDYFYVVLRTMKPSPDLSTTHRPNPIDTPDFNGPSSMGKYLLLPLALGGTYRVVGNAGSRFAVSDEITLNANDPIRSVDLKFVEGVKLRGKVSAPDGQPVSGLKVQMNTYLYGGFSTETTTDYDGVFAFEHVNPNGIGYRLCIKPGANTQGVDISHPIPSDQPLDIRPKAGLAAKGRVFDADTGKPIANAMVTLAPAVVSANYKEEINLIANQQGEFEARGLEKIPYSIVVKNYLAPDAKITRDASGKVVSVQISPSGNGPLIVGGKSDITSIPRIRSPWAVP